MQYTPNFNFMIAEGTDTVNLLTQCYPNFTSLDTILQAIKEAGVTEAVTTKVGTVHNIVRNVADCNVIRWVNTANYAAGDTFTVDGTPVTATTMDGQSLPAGAFVINQSCLAILNGTVLTFVGGTGSSTVAAQDVTYDNSGSGLTAADVQDAIDEVLGDIPTGFAATAITYDNTVSGLTAADVQDAIDELAAAISAPYLPTGLSIFSSRVSIVSGGYRVTGDGYCEVDITVQALMNLASNQGLIGGFPTQIGTGQATGVMNGLVIQLGGSGSELTATNSISSGSVIRFVGRYPYA